MMNSEAGNSQLVAKSTLPHSPPRLLPAWAFFSNSARGEAACTGWGGRMGPAPGNSQSQGGWLVDRAVPASWFRRNCTARLTLCSVGWEVLNLPHSGWGVLPSAVPHPSPGPKSPAGPAQKSGMWWFGMDGLAEGTQRFKGPCPLDLSLVPLKLPRKPRTWLVGLHLLPHQSFPQSLGLNPGQEPL